MTRFAQFYSGTKIGDICVFEHIPSLFYVFLFVFVLVHFTGFQMAIFSSHLSLGLLMPWPQRLQRFDCNNKLARSMSLKVFYFFTSITLPLLHTFGEHTSVSSIVLFFEAEKKNVDNDCESKILYFCLVL